MPVRQIAHSAEIELIALTSVFLCLSMSSHAANQPPVVDAGPDANMDIGADSGLLGSATDDGLPTGTLTYSWTLVNGNASGVEMTVYAQYPEILGVRFSELGEYTFRLTVDDGELQGFDEVTITAVPPPSITLISPVGGETLIVGQTFFIQWTADRVYMNRVWIAFSTDGAVWTRIDYLEDTDPDWGYYSWTVPDSPSTECFIRIQDFWEEVTATSGPFEILTSGTSSDADGDGMPTVWETTHGLNPNSAGDAGADGDRDDLTNLQEFLLSTDPNEWDTDGDKFPDGAEVAAGYDPTDPLDTPPGEPPDRPHVSGNGCIPGAPAGGWGGCVLLAMLAVQAMLRTFFARSSRRAPHGA